MVPYFKTQWWRLLCALVCLVYSGVVAFNSTAVADSVEGVYLLLGDVVQCATWFIASCCWCIMSFVSHNEDCIKALEKRVAQLENRAITDIDEISKNNFMVRRRLGPDKEGK